MPVTASTPIKCFWAVLLSALIHASPVAAGGQAAVVLWDESVDGDLPFNLLSLSPEELADFTFVLNAPVSNVIGHSDVGEKFLIVVPARKQLVEVRVEFQNTEDQNLHILSVEPFPFGASTPPCLQSQTFTELHEMPTVGSYAYAATFISPGPPETYAVSSDMAVTGIPVPAQFAISFVVEDAPIFKSGFACMQFPEHNGS